jgi:endonuclease III
VSTPAARLVRQLDLLEQLHGPPARPAPRGALQWILWENAAYLQPDEKHARAYRELARKTGLTADGIDSLPPHELAAWARLGGMLPERRVEKLRAIAALVQERFGGDLDAALDGPLAKARAALKRFPGIGAPGADKILLFTGRHPLLALESNGLRVLLRLGYAPEGKSYAASYAGVQRALAPLAKRGIGWLQRAHGLLRRHGRELCKHSAPRCDACPLAAQCPAAE